MSQNLRHRFMGGVFEKTATRVPKTGVAEGVLGVYGGPSETLDGGILAAPAEARTGDSSAGVCCAPSTPCTVPQSPWL